MGINEKIQEYKKLAKRANVRISALKANKQERFIVEKSALNAKGKFYEGTKFKDEKTLDSALQHVKHFLESNTTLRKIKKTTHKEASIAPVFDYEQLKKMTYNEKLEQSRKLARIANGRLSTLRKNGIDYYAIEKANHYLKNEGRKNFYTGHKFNSKHDLNTQLRELSKFLNSKSSTMTGLKKIRNERINVFNEKLGIDLTDITTEKNFFDFLSSQQFETLARFGDSEDVIEDFVNALRQGYTKDEINEQYQEYLNNSHDMTFEEVQELRDSGYFMY